jgi:hypothetical protein
MSDKTSKLHDQIKHSSALLSGDNPHYFEITQLVSFAESQQGDCALLQTDTAEFNEYRSIFMPALGALTARWSVDAAHANMHRMIRSCSP